MQDGSQGCFKAEEGCLLADRRAVMSEMEVLEDGGGEPRLVKGRGGLSLSRWTSAHVWAGSPGGGEQRLV